MNFRKTLLVILFSLMTISMLKNLHADGMSVEKWLTLKDVVKKSSSIFTAKIIDIDHEYRKREAYGEVRRYVTKYRFKVKIEKVLKGDGELKLLLKKQDNIVWIERYGDYVPGKWVVVSEMYRQSFFLEGGKKGMSFIVYGGSISNGKIDFSYTDKVEMLDKVEGLMKK